MSDRPLDLLSLHATIAPFPDEYRNAVFLTWYSRGKVNAETLRGYLEPDINGNTPAVSTLRDWIYGAEFKAHAEELDNLIKVTIDSQVVTEKIEMLTRHANLGRRMQDLALAYLEDHQDEIRANSAVRMLVDGVRIERESRGLPSLLADTNDATDEELMKSIEKLINLADINEDVEG